MRICFLFSAKPPLNAEEISADIFLLPFSHLSEVNFDDEIAGKSEKLKALAKLSKKLSASVICGAYTDVKSIKRKSAIIADRGKIIGVADSVNLLGDKKYKVGAGLKIFDLPAGKIGVAVAEDVLFPDVIKSLSECGCSAILCPFENISSSPIITVARAHAFIYGINICLCANNYSFAASPFGDVAFSTAQNNFIHEFSPAGEYHTAEKKSRGFFGLWKS